MTNFFRHIRQGFLTKSSFLLYIIILFLQLGCINSKQPVHEGPTDQHSIFPDPVGFVNDFENLLSDEEESILNDTLINYERISTNEIVVLSIADISPYDSIFDYSLDLANYWGIGKQNLNNGVLIAVSENLRRMRIQNGYGIELLLTDEETKNIVDSFFIPEFKNDNYFLGLMNGIQEIKKKLNSPK